MRTAEEKVPGGKLVRVTVRKDGAVEITGDFFAHPEDGIVLVENALILLDGTESPVEVETLLNRIIVEAGIELLGIDVPVIVRLYRQCDR
ncbi:MAG TPA: hypothetical protein VGJ92_12945 [Methanocella sp.]|jgi:lipoate-protein ligase A